MDKSILYQNMNIIIFIQKSHKKFTKNVTSQMYA